MEAKCSSETSVDFKRTTWRYFSEDRNLFKKDQAIEESIYTARGKG
jgi:hypothetical protein